MEVTGRDGFNLEAYDGDEGQLVDNVVREVVNKNKGRRRKYFGKNNVKRTKLTAVNGTAI